jgi:plasmid stabilization system protein ParE
MKRQIILRPEAQADIEQAALYYEEQRPRLGLRFISELERFFSRVIESPQQFPELEEGVRRGLLHRFPFGIYFIAEGERTIVLAVLHHHRQPDVWKQRK